MGKRYKSAYINEACLKMYIYILIKKKYTLNNLGKEEIWCGKYLTYGATA
jgi:hypothetical protein